MQNYDVTHNCKSELVLWLDNDPFFYQEWKKTIRTGNLTYIKDAFEEAGFKYRKDQWEEVVDQFEFELKEEEERLDSYCSILQSVSYTHLTLPTIYSV